MSIQIIDEGTNNNGDDKFIKIFGVVSIIIIAVAVLGMIMLIGKLL